MNMPPVVTGILHWLQAQLAALLPTVKAIAGNSPQPAQTTVISTVVLLGIAWAVLKIAGKAKK